MRAGSGGFTSAPIQNSRRSRTGGQVQLGTGGQIRRSADNGCRPGNHVKVMRRYGARPEAQKVQWLGAVRQPALADDRVAFPTPGNREERRAARRRWAA